LLSRLAYSLVALVAFDTLIAAITKTLLHPAVAIAGLIWIAAITLIIWRKGGVVIDALFGAAIINLEVAHEEKDKGGNPKKFRPGHDFMQALALLGMIAMFITSFFLVVPIWRSWSLYFTLMIFLIGWRCAATIAESTFNWDHVRVAYKVSCAVGVAVILLIAGHQFITGEPLTVQAVRMTLQQGGIGKMFFWPILLIIVGAVLPQKTPFKGFLKAAGILILLYLVFSNFLYPMGREELKAMEKDYRPQVKTEAKINSKDLNTVTLSSRRWSNPVYLQPCTVYEIAGPTGSVYRLLADPEKNEYPVGVRKFKDEESKKGIPTDERFQHGIQFKGLPGQDGQTIYIRRVPRGMPPNIEEESS
jgi:hypothetical protein